MGALRLGLAALALCAAAPVQAQLLEIWRPYIAEASARFGIPAAWIERVMRVESGGRTVLNGRPITSPAGAMGLMQLMPGTWTALRARLGLGRDPHHPRDNILAGAYYLRLMYERFGYPGLFAAYNAGPARYAGHLATGRALPAETRLYVARVAAPARPVARAPDAPARDRLFAIAVAPPAAPAPSTAPAVNGLFFTLSGASGAPR